MAVLRYTRQVRSDINHIWLQIATNGLSVADKWTDRILARCEQLADFPESGSPRPDIAADARMLVIERWLIFYRIDADGVQIARIVDSARDISDLELPPE